MPKAVAIPYIIAIVIGIIVLVLLVYWIYKIVTTPVLGCQDCKSMFIDWCAGCANLNAGSPTWPTDFSKSTSLINCLNNCPGLGTSGGSCSTNLANCKAVGVKPIS